MAELTLTTAPSTTLTVEFDGHRSTIELPIGSWVPLHLIDAEPAAYLRLEPAADAHNP
jgi:hypothetical protein